jgi:HD-GYP domain-containing protein (c-di-GMP phosphodiesterase class II)
MSTSPLRVLLLEDNAGDARLVHRTLGEHAPDAFAVVWVERLATALQHHERVDGGGYPRGLKNEAIPIEARIMAVAHVVEAMSSHRPYRPALGIEMALAEIECGSGTLYDPAVVAACLTLFQDSGYAIPG